MIQKCIHDQYGQDGLRNLQKPQVIDNYNYFMSGVHRNGQRKSYLCNEHCNIKWWKKLVMLMLVKSNINAYILYKFESEKPGHKITSHVSQVPKKM